MVHTERGRDQAALDRKNQASRDWYRANREKHNADRRAKYQTDEKYRSTVKERSREYKRTNPKHEGSLRLVNGERIRMYRIGEVAKYLRCSIRTIRRWEAKGIIPPAGTRALSSHIQTNSHRVYTLHQIGLMLGLVKMSPSARMVKAEETRREW